MTFLETILEHKAEEVARRRREHPIDELTGSIYFARSLRSLSAAIHQASPAIIAELKKASPSRGEIRKDFRPADFARGYEAAGACAISVLTDERFFSGSLRNLVLARDAVSIPVLRKDFIIDAYQIYEARAHGADAILLIVAALPPSQLTNLMEVAKSLGLECLVEVHSKDELDVAVRAGAELIGVNNRDLHTFSVDLRTTIDLLPIVPRAVTLVSESGIGTAEQILLLVEQGVQGFLLGESLMRTKDPGKTLADLIGSVRRATA